MKPESTVQQEVQIAARYEQCTLMRNNSGAFQDATGRWIFFGLGNISKKHGENTKSSDLIGFTEVIITPDMVGQKVAIFTAVECKDEIWSSNKKLDKRETAQNNFIQWVKSKGGYAGFANSVDSLKAILKR